MPLKPRRGWLIFAYCQHFHGNKQETHFKGIDLGWKPAYTLSLGIELSSGTKKPFSCMEKVSLKIMGIISIRGALQA